MNAALSKDLNYGLEPTEIYRLSSSDADAVEGGSLSDICHEERPDAAISVRKICNDREVCFEGSKQKEFLKLDPPKLTPIEGGTMPVNPGVECEECGALKRAANKWLVMRGISDGRVLIDRTPAFTDLQLQNWLHEDKIYCGEACLSKALSKWLGDRV